ncbi:MAG: hypothetical protein RR978_09670 [Oscillospiraceae bacterium]
MATLVACLVAGVSTAAFIALWFWVVRRELCAKQKPVKAARCQFIASKQAYLRARDGPKEKQAKEIMERSERIYRQSAEFYNALVRKPWNVIPALFLGYQQEKENNQTE